MKKTVLVTFGALALVACDSAGEAPADNSPVTPEVVCEESVDVNATASECVKAEAETAEDMNLPAGN